MAHPCLGNGSGSGESRYANSSLRLNKKKTIPKYHSLKILSVKRDACVILHDI